MPPQFACCFEDGSCIEIAEYVCDAAGGVWYEGVYCRPQNPCSPPIIVCCLDDGSCEEFTTEDDCVTAGGVIFWDLESCDPNECPPSGSDDASWGSIKAMYRR